MGDFLILEDYLSIEPIEGIEEEGGIESFKIGKIRSIVAKNCLKVKRLVEVRKRSLARARYVHKTQYFGRQKCLWYECPRGDNPWYKAYIPRKHIFAALGSNLDLFAVSVLAKQRELKTLRSAKVGNLLYNIL